MKRQQHQSIDRRIFEKTRPRERVDSPAPRVYTFDEMMDRLPIALSNVKYTGVRFIEAQESPAKSPTSHTQWSVTNGNYASGDAGFVSGGALGQWSDTTKSWSVDEWAGYYLKRNTGYFRIHSNTSNTLNLSDSYAHPGSSGEYEIVAHEQRALVGLKLKPEPLVYAAFDITGNSESEIYVRNERSVVFNGMIEHLYTSVGGTGGVVEVSDLVVGTGDNFSVAMVAWNEYGNQVILDISGFSSTDFVGSTYTGFAGWYIRMLSGEASGQVGTVDSFDNGSGHFEVTGLAGEISTGDSFVLECDINSLDPTGYQIIGGYDLYHRDFTERDPEDIERTYYTSPDGDIDIEVEGSSGGVNLRYSIDLYAPAAVEVPVEISTTNTFRIAIKGAEQAKNVNNAILRFSAGWNRVDIFMYSEWGSGISVHGARMPLGRYFTSWRDPSPGAPGWSSISGAGSTPKQEGQVSLAWINNGMLGVDGGTEIWCKASGESSFSFVERVPSPQSTFVHTGLDANKSYIYKLRHYTGKGFLSAYSSENTGATAPDVGADGSGVLSVTVDGGGYYRDGDTLTITVTTGSSYVGLQAAPMLTIGGSAVGAPESVSNDGFFTSCVWEVDLSGSSPEGEQTVLATATTIGGSSVSGSTTIGIDHEAPSLSEGDLILDSDDNIGNGSQLYCSRPDRVFIHKGVNLTDISGVSGWASGIEYLRIMNGLQGTGTGGSGQLVDSSLPYSAISSCDFENYILTDSNGDHFTVDSIELSGSGTKWNLTSGTPATGEYTVTPYRLTYKHLWYSALFTADASTEWDLTRGMPYDGDTIPATLSESNAFRVFMAAVDRAGNVSNALSADMHYNPYATNAPILTYEFRDSSGEVFPNSNGWFNDNPLYLRMMARAPDDNIKIESIFYSVNGGAFNEVSVDSASGSHDFALSNGKGNTIDFYATTSAISGPAQVVRVAYNRDTTPPVWSPSALTPVGGFNRIVLGWENAPVDAVSGPWKIDIYRNTEDVSSGATHVARIDASVFGYIDTEAAYGTNYYYWAKAVDAAENESVTYLELGGPVQSEQIVPADVDGALRITNPLNTASGSTEWQVGYGITVPIESVTIQFGSFAGSPDEPEEITAIEYWNGSSWVAVSNAKVNGQDISFPYDIASYENDQLTVMFDPQQGRTKWRVRFDNGNEEPWQIGSQIERVDFNSILAADLIVAGVLRLETGLTVWSGSFDASGDMTGGGVGLDQAGMYLWDSAGNVTVALYGTPVSGNIGVFGSVSGRQVLISSDGKVIIDGGALKIAGGGNLVKNSNFEAELSYFTQSGDGDGWVAATGNAVHGEYCAHLDSNAVDSETKRLKTNPIPVSNAQSYLFSFFHKLSYTSGQFHVKVQQLDAAGGDISTATLKTYTSSVASMTRDYARITGLNASTRFLVFQFYVSYGPSMPEGDWWIDCLQLEESDNAEQISPTAWTPGGFTLIDGNVITTGKIESNDGTTYIDLDNNKIAMDDGTGLVELSSSEGLKGEYDSVKMFDLGVKTGLAYFRGGVINGRSAKIPELARELGYGVDDTDQSITGFSSSPNFKQSVLANGYIWVADVVSIKQVDRFSGEILNTYSCPSGEVNTICHVGGGMLWCGDSGAGSGANDRGLKRFNTNTESFDKYIDTHAVNGGLAVYGLSYDSVNDYVWLASQGSSGTRFYYLDLSDDSLGYVSITLNTGGSQVLAGVAFDGTYIWTCTGNATGVGALHRIAVSTLSVTNVNVSEKFAAAEVVFDGVNVWFGNMSQSSVLHYKLLRVADRDGSPFTYESYLSVSASDQVMAMVVAGDHLWWVQDGTTLYTTSLYTLETNRVVGVSTFTGLTRGCYDGVNVWIPNGTKLLRIA